MLKKNCSGVSCTTAMVANILLIVGGINWGLIGLGTLFNASESWNVVNMLLGGMPTIEAIVYVVVGVAAVASIFGCMCKTCHSGVCNSCAPENKI